MCQGLEHSERRRGQRFSGILVGARVSPTGNDDILTKGSDGQFKLEINEEKGKVLTIVVVEVSDYDGIKIDQGETEGRCNYARDAVRSLQLDVLSAAPGQKDPLEVCMPASVLSAWVASYKDTTPNHEELAAVSNNWRKSMSLYSMLIKEAKSAAKGLQSHVDSYKKLCEALVLRLFDSTWLWNLSLDLGRALLCQEVVGRKLHGVGLSIEHMSVCFGPGLDCLKYTSWFGVLGNVFLNVCVHI